MEDGNVTTVVQLLTTQHYKATPGTAQCAVTICVRTAWEMNLWIRLALHRSILVEPEVSKRQQPLGLVLIASQRKTLGSQEIICHPLQTMMFLKHLQQREAMLLLSQKTQMTIQNALFAWSSPKMPQLSMVTQDTVAVAGPVHRF